MKKIASNRLRFFFVLNFSFLSYRVHRLREDGQTEPSAGYYPLYKFKKSVKIFVFVLALQVCEKLIGEKLFAEDDLLCAAVHEEHEQNRSKLRPCHFVFAAFDHGKADTGNAGAVAEFRLGKIKHLAERDQIVSENFFVLFDFFRCEYNHIRIVFHCFFLSFQKIYKT
jgi:hypothetical protein